MVPSLTLVSPQVHVAIRPCTWAHLGPLAPQGRSSEVPPVCPGARACGRPRLVSR